MSSVSQIKDVKPKHPAVTVAKKYLAYLHKNDKGTQYLSENDLAELQIEWTKIDIDTGIPEYAGLHLIKPKPLDEMKATAEAADLEKDPAVPTIGEYSPGNWHTASMIGECYYEFLDQLEPDHPDQPSETPGQLGSWKLDDPVNVDSNKSERDWQLQFIINFSSSLPDTIGFLATNTPLEEGKLLRGEIFCILRMTVIKLKRTYRDHEIAPVTLVSASRRDLRIVQGYVNGDGRVIVRVSTIVGLDGENALNFHNLLRIGAWFLGNPCRVGGTTLEDRRN